MEINEQPVKEGDIVSIVVSGFGKKMGDAIGRIDGGCAVIIVGLLARENIGKRVTVRITHVQHNCAFAEVAKDGEKE